MILLSNGGTNQHRNRQRSDTMAIGTVALRSDPHVSVGTFGRLPLFDVAPPPEAVIRDVPETAFGDAVQKV